MEENRDLPSSAGHSAELDEEMGDSRTAEPMAADRHPLDSARHSETQHDTGSRRFQEGEWEEGADADTEGGPEAPVNISPAPFDDRQPTEPVETAGDQVTRFRPIPSIPRSEKAASERLPGKQTDPSEPAMAIMQPAELAASEPDDSSARERAMKEQLDQDHRYATPADGEPPSTRSAADAPVVTALAD